MLFYRLSLMLLSILLIISAIVYVFATKEALFSFVVAYLSSSIVVLASFKNYKTMVEKRLKLASSSDFSDRDTIDNIEDPYNLYDDVPQIDENRNFKDIIQEEKAKLKEHKRPLKDTIRDSARAFSPMRLGAYAILFLGLFALVKSNNLNIFFYLATLIIPNIVAVIFLVNFKK